MSFAGVSVVCYVSPPDATSAPALATAKTDGDGMINAAISVISSVYRKYFMLAPCLWLTNS